MNDNNAPLPSDHIYSAAHRVFPRDHYEQRECYQHLRKCKRESFELLEAMDGLIKDLTPVLAEEIPLVITESSQPKCPLSEDLHTVAARIATAKQRILLIRERLCI